jgi:hypothetical protein
MSSLGCLDSTCSRVPRARRRRRLLIITPCTIPGSPRAHIKTKAPLRHILEMPLLGRVGIDLHLGQKPKLGGRYADKSLIYTSYYVGTLYIHVSLSFFFFVVLVLLLLSKNTKRPKIFLLFLFVWFFSFLVLVCFTFYCRLLHFLLSVWYSKNPKRFCFVCYFLLFLF